MSATDPAAPLAPGAPRAAEGNAPLRPDPARVWVVRSGRIDVFATRWAGAEPEGPRRHLFRLEAGDPVFGVGEDPSAAEGLLAAGAPGTLLDEHPLADVRVLAADPATRAGFGLLVERWAERVWAGLVGRAAGPRTAAAAAGEEAAPEPGAALSPEDAVAWLEVLEGSVRLLGSPGAVLGPGEALPLTRRGWAVAGEGARVRFRPLAEVLAAEPGAAHEGLARLHACALAIARDRAAEDAAGYAERAAARERARRAGMESALVRLASTLRTAPAEWAMRLRPPGEAGAEDTLFAALRLVAGAQGIPLGEPAGSAGGRDAVLAMARRCRVRARRVVLRGEWWRSDAGPLVGRWADGPAPVALLPAAGGYEVLDPADRSRVRVDAAVAARVGPTAYMVYRPFPDRKLTPWQVLRFGVAGMRRDLVVVLAAAALSALLGLVVPVATGMLFDAVIPGAERGQLVQLTLVLFACALAAALFTVVRGIALVRVESRTSAAVQAAVWDRLVALPLPFFRDYTAGELAMRAMGIEEIRRVMTGAVTAGLLAGLFSLSNLVLLLHYDTRLGAVAAGLIALSLAASVAVGVLQLRSQRAILTLRSRIGGMLLQFLNGIPKIRTSGAEAQAFARWARAFGDQREKQYRNRMLGVRLTVFNAAYPVVCSLILFWLAAARLEGEDGMTTGTFLGFMAAFGLCLGAVLSTSNALLQALSAVPLYEHVRPILDTPPEVRPGKEPPGTLSGAIDLQHVSFRYEAGGPLVLRDVSVRIQPGEFVAFVGPSGSGKSTLLRLLLGFETPEVGSVAYDQQDLAGLDVEAVRRQLGVVLQSSRVMGGDLFTNIAGSSAATLDEVWEAARMAGLDEDIRRMPMGMHTVVSQGGGTLSGGQRQRLMIARAVVGRPRILLMDEATSALDNRTQAIVSESLERLRATRVVIAHRLSTVARADRIHVVAAGSIVESGTYAELMARGGVFAALARRQLT